jgi:hypothetical protein
MKNIKRIINQAINYYETPSERYSLEGDELPYQLEHITSEKLYREFIENTSDDYELMLMRNKIKKKGL